MGEVEWDVIPSTPYPAHMHMALDEVLLAQLQGHPATRLVRPGALTPAAISLARSACTRS